MQWLPRSQCGRARCLGMDSHGDEQCGTGVVIMLVQRAVPHFDCDCQAKAYIIFISRRPTCLRRRMHTRVLSKYPGTLTRVEIYSGRRTESDTLGYLPAG